LVGGGPPVRCMIVPISRREGSDEPVVASGAIPIVCVAWSPPWPGSGAGASGVRPATSFAHRTRLPRLAGPQPDAGQPGHVPGPRAGGHDGAPSAPWGRRPPGRWRRRAELR